MNNPNAQSRTPPSHQHPQRTSNPDPNRPIHNSASSRIDTNRQVEAQRIGIQLQNILRLPSASSPNNPPPPLTSHQHQYQQNPSSKGPGPKTNYNDPSTGVGIRLMSTKPSHDPKMNANRMVGQQVPPTLQPKMINQINQQQQRRPEPIPLSNNKQPNSGNRGDSNRSGRPNNEQYREGLTLPQRKVRDSISSCLRDPNCPDYIRKERSRIIEAAFDEMKPSYFVNFMDPVILQILKLHTVEPMQKRNPKFQRAKYFCNACYYHMDNIQSILIHLISPRHVESLKIRNIGSMLEYIPLPSPSHTEALTKLLLHLYGEIGMMTDDINARVKAAKFVDNYISEILEYPANLTLIGSTVPGFGFKWSDINLNLDFTNVFDSTALVYKCAWALRTKADLFSNVQIQSHRITFTLVGSNFPVVIHFNNKGAEKTAELFEKFNKIDSRVRPLVTAFRYAAALLGIDKADDGYWPPHCFTILVLKHLQDIGILPPIVTRNYNEAHDYEYGCLTDEELSQWEVRNNDSLGKVWLSLLRKWSIEFPFEDVVVSLLDVQIYKKSDSGTWNRKLSIQDPTHLKSNLSRSAFHGRVNDYLTNTLKHLFHYFGIPRLVNGVGLYEGIISEAEVPDRGKIYYYDCILECRDTNRKIRAVDMPNEFGELRPYILKEDVALITFIKEPSGFVYTFNKRVFESQQKKPVYCKSCGGEGHARKNCPSERISPCPNYNRPSDYTLSRLSALIESIYGEDGITDCDVNTRIRITQEIDDALRPVFPELQLKLFGSTFNGFGLHNSDIDIAMRVDGRSFHKGDIPPEEVASILDKVNSLLSATGTIDDLRCIATAKVPIVKFRHTPTMLDGDISLSNDLALRNTELLNTYTVIDCRLKMLGCFIKKLTKICDISDASKGSLSSYAYVILLIHYLQRTQPPVLPVLQELPVGGRPEDIVDGWNAYFWNQTAELHLVWRGLGRNTMSLSELFLGFLDYYTKKFNFKEYVVTIRQAAPLSREDKMWISDTLICIEDPFDLGHNLGQGVTNRMGCHIIKTLQRFCEVFYNPVDDLPKDMDLRKLWLNPNRLIISDIPIDRQCRICQRIGHTAKHCEAAGKEKIPENGNGITDPDIGNRLAPPIPSIPVHKSPEPANLIYPPGFEVRNQIPPAPPGFQQQHIPLRQDLWEPNMGWPINGIMDRNFQQMNDSPASTDTINSGPWETNSASGSPVTMIPTRMMPNVPAGYNSRAHPHLLNDSSESLVAGFNSLMLENQIPDFERQQYEEYCRIMLNSNAPLGNTNMNFGQRPNSGFPPGAHPSKSQQPFTYASTYASIAHSGTGIRLNRLPHNSRP